MAKFDIYRTTDGTMLLDCQSDVLAHLNTRFVVPLASPDNAVQVDQRLTPLLHVAGEELLMLTHFAAALPVTALGRLTGSAADQDFTVSNALDMLISGY
ncbi:CcdB family protein [Sphingomonas sp. G-3-2-10]|uniref:CcdB family protein n=1 Tax=Sphingomonas sp. G-3-2-10 TaxID=2728838 RepID=UPI00146C7CD3|nr:CcdB family protein [Sphingomonas sp. G-3-2-10]NML07263.1 plasmid maintenance protein CcdB [Sphingomonas sp. G-3-2-10]